MAQKGARDAARAFIRHIREEIDHSHDDDEAKGYF
jgi:hypothetical protein